MASAFYPSLGDGEAISIEFVKPQGDPQSLQLLLACDKGQDTTFSLLRLVPVVLGRTRLVGNHHPPA